MGYNIVGYIYKQDVRIFISNETSNIYISLVESIESILNVYFIGKEIIAYREFIYI